MTTHHTDKELGMTQCEAILKELELKANQWVPMPQLYNVSGAYAVHSRIADLRKLGHKIENQRRSVLGKRVFVSEYKLEKP